MSTQQLMLYRQAYLHNPDQCIDLLPLARMTVEDIAFVTIGKNYEKNSTNYSGDRTVWNSLRHPIKFINQRIYKRHLGYIQPRTTLAEAWMTQLAQRYE